MGVACLCKQLPVLVVAVMAIPAGATELPLAGIPNFHPVNDHIYRGGQPADAAWRSLANLGVRTVVDLRRRDEHATDVEAQAVKAAGMQYVNVPMSGMMAPSQADVLKVFSLFDSKQPVFVHCKEGKDRTGTVIACYRILRDHWQNRKALKEAESYGMHWLELAMKQYILNFQPMIERAAVAP
jgi:protein tyrosine/serine phosphatase